MASLAKRASPEKETPSNAKNEQKQKKANVYVKSKYAVSTQDGWLWCHAYHGSKRAWQGRYVVFRDGAPKLVRKNQRMGIAPSTLTDGDTTFIYGNEEDGIEFAQTLRTALPSLEEVAAFREGVDLYTTTAVVSLVEPEVDHILEVQMLNAAMWDTELPPSSCTRAAFKEVAGVVNGVVNLNPTSKVVNGAKKGPISSFVNTYGPSGIGGSSCLDNYFDSTTSTISAATWSNIKKAMVVAEETVVKALDECKHSDLAGHVSAELTTMLERMAIS